MNHKYVIVFWINFVYSKHRNASWINWYGMSMEEISNGNQIDFEYKFSIDFCEFFPLPMDGFLNSDKSSIFSLLRNGFSMPCITLERV